MFEVELLVWLVGCDINLCWGECLDCGLCDCCDECGFCDDCCGGVGKGGLCDECVCGGEVCGVNVGGCD